jgi:Amidohydrolase
MFHHLIGAVALLGVLTIVTSGLQPAAAQKSPVPIVDAHVHFLPGSGLAFDEAVASAAQTMDEFGVVRSIVMSPPRDRRVRINYDYADFRAALSRYPGRFAYLAGGGTLNIQLHGQAGHDAVSEAVTSNFATSARKAIDDGALGFGEMSSLHISLSRDHGYNYVPADHPLLLTLADIAAARDVPIDLHMDAAAAAMPPPPRLAQLPNNPPVFPATLNSLERLLSHNRNARIVWAHAGSDQLGDLTAQRVSALMDRYPNLMMSLRVVGPQAPAHNKLFSGRDLDPDWLSVLKRHADRFVIGTDNFYAGPDAAGPATITKFSQPNRPKMQATALFLSLIPRDLAEKIGWRNAVRIYKLIDLEKTLPAAADENARAVPTPRAGLCRDGNMDHCRIACERGVKPACARLERNR